MINIVNDGQTTFASGRSMADVDWGRLSWIANFDDLRTERYRDL